MYEFKVEGMHCGSCADGLLDALKRIDSNGKLDADIDTQTITVQTLAPPQIVSAIIEEAGYKVLNQRTTN